ncbi:ferritin-like domain-containing protein [Acetobacterium tundrae]|uniref:Rubrerythrin n=1 Tax=Acetobacterium tundrae TaxID=132932 RepID=A0ABR6WHY9_9FIRM|nr:ferritin family protein [Acetobacterium tundrae]MBC3795762.1 rubrerythrin [Acetobacterium tundrae]
MNSLEFAIKMEHDGEEYYKKQAEINKNNRLNTVFLLLAKDEGRHAQILENEFKELEYSLIDNDTLLETNNVFKGSKNFQNDFKDIPNQVEVYRLALEKERQSIELYEKFLSEASDDKLKELFGYLVKQEKNHYKIFEGLILLVERPEEWVESAEFGTREEY